MTDTRTMPSASIISSIQRDWLAMSIKTPAGATDCRNQLGLARAGDIPLSPAGALLVPRDGVSLESRAGAGGGGHRQHHPIRLLHGRVGLSSPSFLPRLRRPTQMDNRINTMFQ